MEFFKDFDHYSFQELDGHGILMKLFKDFDQNSDDHRNPKGILIFKI